MSLLIQFSLWINCLFKFKKLQYVYLWFSSPVHVRVTDEAWIAESSKYGPCLSFWMLFLLLKEHFKIYSTAHSLSLSPTHRPNMTEILSKGRKITSQSSIHSVHVCGVSPMHGHWKEKCHCSVHFFFFFFCIISFQNKIPLLIVVGCYQSWQRTLQPFQSHKNFVEPPPLPPSTHTPRKVTKNLTPSPTPSNLTHSPYYICTLEWLQRVVHPQTTSRHASPPSTGSQTSFADKKALWRSDITL